MPKWTSRTTQKREFWVLQNTPKTDLDFEMFSDTETDDDDNDVISDMPKLQSQT